VFQEMVVVTGPVFAPVFVQGRWVYMSSTIGHFPRLIQVFIVIVIPYPSCVHKFVFIRIEMCSKQIYTYIGAYAFLQDNNWDQIFLQVGGSKLGHRGAEVLSICLYCVFCQRI
jgi:hypothetical protein